jgi:hypothetical protein
MHPHAKAIKTAALLPIQPQDSMRPTQQDKGASSLPVPTGSDFLAS